MRTLRIRSLMRFCDGLVTVLAVLAMGFLFNRITGNHRRFMILGKNTTRITANRQEEPHQTRAVQGRLGVQVWKNICGGKMANLLDSPFFPKFFDESYFITQTRQQLNTSNYGQRIFGYLHPPETGYYKFVLYSDDGSEFWFGDTADLQHMKLAGSVASRQTIGSAPVGEIRYNTQLSGDFLLDYGTKYPFEIVHLQGTQSDFIELRWIRPGKNTLEVIGSKHVSCCDELQAISGNFRKFANAVNDKNKFFLVAFLTERIVQRTLNTCDTPISLPAAAKPHLPRFHGYKAVEEMHAVTRDWGENWRSNSEAKTVVELFMLGLEKIFPRKYTVTRLLSLKRFLPGKVDGAILYLLELELGCDALDYPERVVEYVYLQNIDQEGISNTTPTLCYPKGLGWRKEATVHLILSVDNEDQPLRRFIETLDMIIQESLEVDFCLVIVHSCNSGLDVESLLKKSWLQRYQVQKLEGKFSKARAINAAVNLVQNPDDIIFICDVQVVLPPTIFEDCRKHCLNGKMVFAPVLFSLECGAYPHKPQGWWCKHDYRMIGMYQKDWSTVGGLDETLEDHLVPLDLVDHILANGLNVARVRSPKLYLLFYPEAFDPYKPINVQNTSGYFKEDI